MLASYLGWNDVAPSRRPPVDRAALEERVHAFVVGGRGRDPDEVAASIDRWLVATHGPWIAGWRWSAEDSGGPVRCWQLNGETLYREDDLDAEASTARVLAALDEWQSFLVELESRFADLEAGDGAWLAQGIVFAAADLLPLILERTGVEDSWYRTLVKALTWYAESHGHDADLVEPIIGEVIGGRFTSWVAPDPTQATAMFDALSSRLARVEPRVVDATAVWRDLRSDGLRRHIDPKPRDPLRVDGHRRFITTHEHARDAARADAMNVALDACREAAAAERPLGVALLSAWQAIVLGRGQDAPFRTSDAFAHNGRERYAYTPDLVALFEESIDEANDRAVPVEIRAARAYLDVSFFHPFEDGNARAARLALDFVLAREGLGLHAVEPLFLLARSAMDRRSVYNFARLVEHLVGPFSE